LLKYQKSYQENVSFVKQCDIFEPAQDSNIRRSIRLQKTVDRIENILEFGINVPLSFRILLEKESIKFNRNYLDRKDNIVTILISGGALFTLLFLPNFPGNTLIPDFRVLKSSNGLTNKVH